MKVSINLAQRYSNVDLKGISKDEMIRRIGAQLGSIEEVIDWGAKYKDVIVARVAECVKHPDADKLHVCKIDDGGRAKHVERDSSGFVQVVCGAPNVKEGMFVAWLPPNTVVPSTMGTSDEFKLGTRELRGVMSNGMLASAHELGISDDHSGILEIILVKTDKKPVAGDIFSNYYGLDDVVIDCENKMFTHRPDCFGNLGVARELAGINGLNFKSPDWYINEVNIETSSKLPFVSKNDIPKLVPRFMARVIEGVNIHPSEIGMQIDLIRVGLRPLNNVVDFTNYYMHLTAQPTHAFDYDKIKKLSKGSPSIFPRMAIEGEELALLNGKTVKLTKNDIVIATDTKAVALAGVMGGAETEVDENTKNIIIECATFDMYTIRRTSMRHGIFTDAVTRFNKGQSPSQNNMVLAKLSEDIINDCDAKAGGSVDLIAPGALNQDSVSFTADFINVRLGLSLIDDEIIDILERTELKVEKNKNGLTITPPYWRRDIECAEDVVEEVGRLYGLSELPTELPVRKSVLAKSNRTYDLKRKIARTLSGFGANEVLTYSFIHGNLMESAGQATNNAYKIRNAISPELQYYRQSITPSLLQHVHPNIKAGYPEFAIYEIGAVHAKSYGMTEENVPAEKQTIAFVYASSDKQAKNYDGAAFYTARKYAESLLDKIGIQVKLKPLENESLNGIEHSFDKNRTAVIVEENTNETIGIIGEFSQGVKSKLKLPRHSAGFEIIIDEISKHVSPINYRVPNRFPVSEQDLTIEIEAEVNFSQIHEGIRGAVNFEHHKYGYMIDIKPIDAYSEDTAFKRLTFRFVISHPEKTLSLDEVSSMMSRIVDYLKANHQTLKQV